MSTQINIRLLAGEVGADGGAARAATSTDRTMRRRVSLFSMVFSFVVSSVSR